jgi:hypothetical protein
MATAVPANIVKISELLKPNELSMKENWRQNWRSLSAIFAVPKSWDDSGIQRDHGR